MDGFKCFSVIDIAEAITESPNPRKYWSGLDTKLKKAHNELSARCTTESTCCRRKEICHNKEILYNVSKPSVQSLLPRKIFAYSEKLGRVKR